MGEESLIPLHTYSSTLPSFHLGHINGGGGAHYLQNQFLLFPMAGSLDSSCNRLSVMRSSDLCDGAAVPSLSPNHWKYMNQGPKQSHLNSEKELHYHSETLRINVNETLTRRQSDKGLMGRSKTEGEVLVSFLLL